MNLNDLRKAFDTSSVLSAQADSAIARYDEICRRIEQLEAKKRELESGVRLAERITADAWKAYIDARASMCGILTGLANDVIASVFKDENVRLSVREVKYGGHLGIEFVLEDASTGAKRPVSEGFGRGLREVAALALRIATLEIVGGDRVLVLDEPVPSLDSERQAYLGDTVSEFCDEHGYQMLIVTHSDEFASASPNVLRLGNEAEDS